MDFIQCTKCGKTIKPYEKHKCLIADYALLGEEAMTTTTFTIREECKHVGWYHYVKFLCFKRKFLACEKCGELIPQSKWGFFV